MTQHSHAIRDFGGHRPQLGARVFVDSSAVVIGDVVLGDDVSVWPQVARDKSPSLEFMYMHVKKTLGPGTSKMV